MLVDAADSVTLADPVAGAAVPEGVTDVDASGTLLVGEGVAVGLGAVYAATESRIPADDRNGYGRKMRHAVADPTGSAPSAVRLKAGNTASTTAAATSRGHTAAGGATAAVAGTKAARGGVAPCASGCASGDTGLMLHSARLALQ